MEQLLFYRKRYSKDIDASCEERGYVNVTLHILTQIKTYLPLVFCQMKDLVAGFQVYTPKGTI